nr:hypothetical protein [Bacteroides sp.]
MYGYVTLPHTIIIIEDIIQPKSEYILMESTPISETTLPPSIGHTSAFNSSHGIRSSYIVHVTHHDGRMLFSLQTLVYGICFQFSHRIAEFNV